MRVLLVQPPMTIYKSERKACHPPLGLSYLAAAIKGSHEVFVLDAVADGYDFQEIPSKGYLRYGLGFSEIKKRIAQIKPDVVGVSSLFSAQYQNAAGVCSAVKEADRKIVTVVGGAHPSSVPAEVLKDANIDFAVIAEGEAVFKQLLAQLEAGQDASGIAGLACRAQGKTRINPRQNYEADLDKLDFPYWQIFPLENYFRINNPHGGRARHTPFLPVVSSRGCPFECVFCSIHNLWGRIYRKRSAANVLAEIDHLVKEFGVKEIMFEDDNLILDKERARRIFEGLLSPARALSWSVPNGVAIQTLDEDMLTLMRQSGCYALSIGVESADEHILKDVIVKPIDLKQAKPIIDIARRLGMRTSAFFVVGLPDETRARLKKTFRFARKLGADYANFFFAMPLPGTRLLELCRKKGLIKGELDYSRLKSDRPCFDNGFISISRLRMMVQAEKLKTRLFYGLRHPVGALRKLLTRRN